MSGPTPFLGYAAASRELDLDVAEGKRDPTNAERQRLYRARRKAEAEGKIEVTIGDRRLWVEPTIAEKWLAEADLAADGS